jgi:hypothetical protein
MPISSSSPCTACSNTYESLLACMNVPCHNQQRIETSPVFLFTLCNKISHASSVPGDSVTMLRPSELAAAADVGGCTAMHLLEDLATWNAAIIVRRISNSAMDDAIASVICRSAPRAGELVLSKTIQELTTGSVFTAEPRAR